MPLIHWNHVARELNRRAFQRIVPRSPRCPLQWAFAPGIAVLLVLLLAPSSLQAQTELPGFDQAEADSLHGELLGEAGLGFVPAVPIGEFDVFIDTGFGIGGFARLHLDSAGWIGLRLDLGLVSYGSTTSTRPLFEGDERITVDIDTDNTILTADIGPELSLATGRVRPYINGGAGFSYFATNSSVRGTNNQQEFASSTNFDDFTFAARGGGGLLILVYEKEWPVSIDLGAHYLWNGRVQYMTEDSLVQRPDGTVYFLQSIESEANMLMIHVGVAIGIR